MGDAIKRTVAFLAVVAIVGSQAALAQPVSLYDNFSSGGLSPRLWVDHGRVRYVRAGSLDLGLREWGATNSDAGITFVNFNENLPNPAAVTELLASVKVTSLEVHSCTSNPTPGQSRARIVGGFFNVGTPTPGSQVGDVIAQVQMRRNSDSPHPVGVLQIAGIVSLCTNADCSTSQTIGSVPLGSVRLNQAAVLQMRWDQPSKTFFFNRNGNTFRGTVSYLQSDSSPSSVPFKQLSTRVGIPSCQSGPRVSEAVEAVFDNVSVNAAAVPAP